MISKLIKVLLHNAAFLRIVNYSLRVAQSE